MNSNRQWPLSYTRYITSCAANAGQELALGGFPNNRAQLLRVSFFPDTDIETDTDSGFYFYVLNKGTSGTANTTIATYNSGTAAATLSKYKAIDVPITGSLSSVDEGEYLTWKEATLGTGTARANGFVLVEYTLY